MADVVEGEIRVNGLDILNSGLSKKTTRKMLGMISQEPTVFEATVRYNMDPLDEFTDAECFAALELSYFTTAIKGDSDPQIDSDSEAQSAYSLLQREISSDSLTLGQRQLLCLARVLLRKPAVVVCDEATASCDDGTDQAVQRALRQYVTEVNPTCCLLTIAHRLGTIRDYDQVLVMAAGKVVERGCPDELVEVEDSIFGRMVRLAQESAQ